MPYQYRAQWSGTTGGPGVTVFNARFTGVNPGSHSQSFANAVRAFFDGVKIALPNEVSITFPAEVQEFSTSTGELTDVHPVTPPASVVGSATGGYAHASGCRIDWHTQAIVAGRRLRGRTYLVPIDSSSFGADGLLTTSRVTYFTAAANGLISAVDALGSLGVWSRTHGMIADVSAPSISRLGSVLRSRRD